MPVTVAGTDGSVEELTMDELTEGLAEDDEEYTPRAG